MIEWGVPSAPPPSLSKPAFQLGGAPIASFFLSLHLRGGLEPGADQSLRQYLAALPINQVKEKGALRSCHRPALPTRSLITLGPAVPGAMPAEVPEPMPRLRSQCEHSAATRAPD